MADDPGAPWGHTVAGEAVLDITVEDALRTCGLPSVPIAHGVDRLVEVDLQQVGKASAVGDLGQKANAKSAAALAFDRRLCSLPPVILRRIAEFKGRRLWPIVLLTGDFAKAHIFHGGGLFGESPLAGRAPVAPLSGAYAARFVRMVMLIERAVKPVKVPGSSGAPPRAGHAAAMHKRLHDIASMGPAEQDFIFWVAGGFVVGELLGYHPWTDIDTWFKPHRSASGHWVVAAGNSPYPVQLLATSDPVTDIESFDLHICQCAVRCVFTRGERYYDLWMTLACWEACARGWAHATAYHVGVADQAKLAGRLAKYAGRGLDVRRFERECRLLEASAREDACAYTWAEIANRAILHHRFPLPVDTYWVISLRRDFILSTTWVPEWLLPEGSQVPVRALFSEAVLLYPCEYVETRSETARRRGPLHWLLRGMYGRRLPVVVQGGARLWSNSLHPRWLVERAVLGGSAVAAAIRRDLLRLPDGSDGAERYALQCTAQARVRVLCRDWRIAPTLDTPAYGAQWCLFLETHDQRMLRTAMYCKDALSMGAHCDHDHERPLFLW